MTSETKEIDVTDDSAERHLHAVQEETKPETHEARTTLPELLRVVDGMVSERGLQVPGWVDVWDGSEGVRRNFPRWLAWTLFEELIADLAKFEVSCPRCGAGSWQPCVKVTGPNVGQRAGEVHSARVKARRERAHRWLRFTADGPEPRQGVTA